jgi:hypothetical protein
MNTMTEYTQAAQNGENVRLADGSVVMLHFNPAGENGWQIDVLYAYDHNDDMIFWNTDGTAFFRDEADISEIVL